MQRFQLRSTCERSAADLGSHFDERIRDRSIESEQMRQRIIYYIDHAENERNLDKKGNDADQRMIVFSFIQCDLLVEQSVFVIHETESESIQLGAHPYHFDRILLDEQGNGEQDDFRKQRKQKNGQTVVADQFIKGSH